MRKCFSLENICQADRTFIPSYRFILEHKLVSLFLDLSDNSSVAFVVLPEFHSNACSKPDLHSTVRRLNQIA